MPIQLSTWSIYMIYTHITHIAFIIITLKVSNDEARGKPQVENTGI